MDAGPIFAGSVVPGVSMMVVVPSLTNSDDGDEPVLGGGGVGAVRAHSEEVGQGVHAPGSVEHGSVLNVGYSQGNKPILIPAVDGDQSGKHKAKEHGEGEVILLLEHHKLVLLQVFHVHGPSGVNDHLVLIQKQPPAVGEKHAVFGVMGVLLGVTVAVVSTVVTRPMPDGPLVGTAVAEHQKELDGVGSGVGAVRPQAVSTSGDTQTVEDMEEDAPEVGLVGSNGDSGEETHEGPKVNESEVGDVEPVELGEEGLKLVAGGGERAGSGSEPTIRGNKGGGMGFLGESKEEDTEGEVESFQGKDVVVVKRSDNEGKGKNELQKDVTLFPVHKLTHHVVRRDKGANGFPQRGENKARGASGGVDGRG